jgi:hypothetical protein
MEKTNEATAMSTPRPWTLDNQLYYHSTLYGPDGSKIFKLHESFMQVDVQKANAELIVKAVNAYDSLVAERDGFQKGTVQLFERVAKLEAENQKLREALDAMKWISVKDRLPEAKTQVLVYWLDCVEIGYLTIPEDKRFTPYWRDSGDEQPCYAKINESAVTHWMPLPEHPKAT